MLFVSIMGLDVGQAPERRGPLVQAVQLGQVGIGKLEVVSGRAATFQAYPTNPTAARASTCRAIAWPTFRRLVDISTNVSQELVHIYVDFYLIAAQPRLIA